MAAAPAPAVAPQWWQKRAPGVRGFSQDAQFCAPRAPPQPGQNFPDARSPQRGHFVSFFESVTREKYHAARLFD
jgi:hypothetical protein